MISQGQRGKRGCEIEANLLMQELAAAVCAACSSGQLQQQKQMPSVIKKKDRPPLVIFQWPLAHPNQKIHYQTE